MVQEKQAKEKEIALEMQGITKHFGTVIANKNVDLTVYKGEILAILGENGCGKTTLMNMISGIYFPDEGKILVDGKEVVIRSPKDAFRYRIGMIHQHFKLVDVFTATENIIMGVKESGRLSMSQAEARVKEISDHYGFHLDPGKKIHEMSVSEKQTVEIIKVLYRNADILILDEPTAVLTPQETDRLFDVLRRMRDDGKSVIIITHKLHEVLALTDRVAILRRGEHIATVQTAETNETELTDMMVGKKTVLNIERSPVQNSVTRLKVSHLMCTDSDGLKSLNDVSFEAKAGEILGIAGIAGSGQRELLEAIAGLQKLDSGEIEYRDPENQDQAINLRSKNPRQIRDMGVRLSFVPEDRLGMGLVGDMGIVDNMMLRSYRAGSNPFLSKRDPKKLADSIIESLAVVTPSDTTPVRRLSGGNLQKVLVGREIAASPTVLMAAYPVRGLDINTSYTIYNLLNEQKKKGTAVIFVGEDLDVLIALCDRILVLNSGRVTGVLDGRTADKQEIGLLMTKTVQEKEENTRE
jgi:simple sugar transport system ATP-binding protein